MENSTKKWLAPAKINWFLHVMDKREDGYHNLETVFQFLDFYDEMTFDVRDDGVISRSYDYGFSEEVDLCMRAAQKLQFVMSQSTTSQTKMQRKLGVDIGLFKRIPAGAGLGGGSSNAATTLLALNYLWKCGLSRDELAEIGLSLGADVPIFIYGNSAFAKGVGEVLSPISLAEHHYLVVTPHIHVSTAEIFCHKQLTRRAQMKKIRALENSIALDFGENQLEPIVRAEYPQVDAIFKWLSEYGHARMSGSGGSVFLAIESKAKAEEILADKPDDVSAFYARGLNRHPLRDRVEV